MKGAHSSIEAEIYEVDQADLADALVGALSRGVKVTLVEDPTVGVNAATAARLRRVGAEVLDFSVQQRQIDHVKLLIVDFGTAVFGGMDWGSGPGGTATSTWPSWGRALPPRRNLCRRRHSQRWPSHPGGA
jgi:hypothetical protein